MLRTINVLRGAGAVVAASLAFTATAASAAPIFFATLPDEPTITRINPSAGLLPNGNVLISGGTHLGKVDEIVNSAEVFDPATGVFSALTAEQQVARTEAGSVTLPGGRVLIVGGYTPNVDLNTAELFNPLTNTFESLPHTMLVTRSGPSASLLHDGKVLVTGGANTQGVLRTAELYNPATGQFEALAAETAVGRDGPAAATLPDGNVLFAGGWPEAGEALKSAELFNARTDKFELLTGPAHETVETRGALRGVTLQDGNVLLAGGASEAGSRKTVELFDPVTNTFALLPAELVDARQDAQVVVLADGKVLVAGGCEGLCSAVPTTDEISSVNRPSRAVTGRATKIGRGRARLNGSVQAETNATVYFQYGTSRRFGRRTKSHAVLGSTVPRSVSASLSHLKRGKRYHYRVVIKSAGGTRFGAARTFVVPRHR